eukprot:PITA_13465
MKQKVDGSIERYKARLVVKGYSQVEGIDFPEIFYPVVKLVSIRTVLALTALLNLELEQLDVKTTFLHGDLNEEIYMEQPEGFVQGCSKRLVCKLRKSLYGLRQSPRQWYKKFDSFMVSQNFIRSEYDHCVYFKSFNSIFIILALYVDDMLIACKSVEEMNNLKVQLSRTFDMKDLRAPKHILGMEIHRDKKNCNLMYVMVSTRPDILHAVGVLSRFMAKPGKEHWQAVKRVLRYLRGKSDHCIVFNGSEGLFYGYVDVDYAGDLEKEDLLQVMSLLLQVEQLVGCQSFKKQLYCPLLKPNI